MYAAVIGEKGALVEKGLPGYPPLLWCWCEWLSAPHCECEFCCVDFTEAVRLGAADLGAMARTSAEHRPNSRGDAQGSGG